MNKCYCGASVPAVGYEEVSFQFCSKQCKKEHMIDSRQKEFNERIKKSNKKSKNRPSCTPKSIGNIRITFNGHGIARKNKKVGNMAGQIGGI